MVWAKGREKKRVVCVRVRAGVGCTWGSPWPAAGARGRPWHDSHGVLAWLVLPEADPAKVVPALPAGHVRAAARVLDHRPALGAGLGVVVKPSPGALIVLQQPPGGLTTAPGWLGPACCQRRAHRRGRVQRPLAGRAPRRPGRVVEGARWADHGHRRNGRVVYVLRQPALGAPLVPAAVAADGVAAQGWGERGGVRGSEIGWNPTHPLVRAGSNPRKEVAPAPG